MLSASTVISFIYGATWDAFLHIKFSTLALLTFGAK